MDANDKYKKLNFIHLASGLKGLRCAHGITLEELGFNTKKDVAYLSRLENSKASPKFETLSTILSYYGITVKEFYDSIDLYL